MADRITPEFLHRHWCEVYGHYYDCRREDCVKAVPRSSVSESPDAAKR